MTMGSASEFVCGVAPPCPARVEAEDRAQDDLPDLAAERGVQRQQVAQVPGE